MKNGPFLTLLLVLSAAPAWADPIPDYVLDKDYKNCVGDDTQDKQRAAYCLCVRNGMKDWDLDTYGNIATQSAQNSQQVPEKLTDLAKSCIDKALH